MATVNARLVGGEMLVWSDLDGSHGPGPVRGSALAPFLAAARGRTLIAGPHDPELVTAAAAADDVTVLIRGVPDAGRYPGVTVLCGGPEGLAAGAAYDTIIALDGLERLGTAEQDELSWVETLRLLRAALRPGGLLILGLANRLGLHRMTVAPRPPADSDWTAAPDDTRPAVAEALSRLLGGVTRTYACYPDPVAPHLVLPADARGGAVEAALARAYDAGSPAELLTDPYPWAVEGLRQGQPLAPGWIVVAADPVPSIDLPLHGPQGPTLERLITGAAARRDLPAVRALLATWQDGPAAGVPAGQVISGPDGRLTPLVPPSTPAEALHELASRLLRDAAGSWPAPRDATDLADLLAAMTGRTPGTRRSTAGHRTITAELLAERDRLTRELAEARAQAAYFEAELTAREADLRGARRTVELLSGTGPARAGQAFVGGVRAARRLLPRRG
ncbi:hypothetical protein [Actinoplanes sp. NPDC049681]|uniref:hypothetical protein n=1 Tax=Actinoplanes sp. NPDC049681 TaxID=3363905 RepID=UPI0037A08FEB